MYWHEIKRAFQMALRFYSPFHWSLNARWYLKPVVIAYMTWYFIVLTGIFFMFLSLYVPIWLLYLIPPVRGRLWPNREPAEVQLREEDEFPPPRPENLKLARVIISHTERSELEEIVTQTLAELPLEKLQRMKAIMLKGA